MTAPAPRPSRLREMRRGADRVRPTADGVHEGTRLRSVGNVPVCFDCYRARRDHCVYCAAWEVLP